MRILGIDPSSTSTGIALVEDGRLMDAACWRASKEPDISITLLKYARWLESHRLTCNLDSVCIERVSVSWNMNSIRKIAYVEGVSMATMRSLGVTNVSQMNPSSARKAVFGKGDIKKDRAYELMTGMYDYVDWAKFKDGGSDMADAAVLGLAGWLTFNGRDPLF